MITDQSGHRCLQDGTDVEIEVLGSLSQLLLEMPGNATHKRHREVGTAIRIDMEAEKILKVTHDNCTHTSIVKVGGDKF